MPLLRSQSLRLAVCLLTLLSLVLTGSVLDTYEPEQVTQAATENWLRLVDTREYEAPGLRRQARLIAKSRQAIGNI